MIPKRLIAVGDIHGELDKLNLLLDWVDPTTDDKFIFLGDYIDRGNNSRGVVEQLIKFGHDFPETIFLRGNHEQMLIDTIEEVSATKNDCFSEPVEERGLRLYDSELDMFLRNGGKETLHSYGLESIENFPEDHLDFVNSTVLWWQYEHFIFVHAGLEPDIPLKKQDPFTLLMARNSPPGKNGDIHVVGHTPTPDGEPVFESGRYRLDTGATFGNSLTACDVLTKTVWQM